MNIILTLITITACTILGIFFGFFVGIWAMSMGMAQSAQKKLSKDELKTYLELVNKIK